MKRNLLVISLLTCAGTGSALVANITVQSSATWSATAKKESTTKLAVTPLGSLSFVYANGAKGFNTHKGLFDVAIEGDASATAFKLTSRLVSNTLTHLDGSGSTLNVYVNYLGMPLDKATDMVIVDTAIGKNSGLRVIAENFNKSGNFATQDSFSFSISSGTLDGITPVKQLSALPEGVWSGDISVQFDATWTS